LESQTAAADDRKPAALLDIYDGTPTRLREVRDPVGGRSIHLSYNRSGDSCYTGRLVGAAARLVRDPGPGAGKRLGTVRRRVRGAQTSQVLGCQAAGVSVTLCGQAVASL
jgi:hypothetical protein